MTPKAFVFPLLILFIIHVSADECTVDESLRTDCGYMGINKQQC